MEAVYPSSASALARGRRARRAGPRSRHRTVPVTFAEIKEVDEENEEATCIEAPEERRRRPDVLDERLARQFAEFRRRRARRDVLREREPDDRESACATACVPARAPACAPACVSRAGSEPAALHAPAGGDT